jgi:hypothetical protein
MLALVEHTFGLAHLSPAADCRQSSSGAQGANGSAGRNGILNYGSNAVVTETIADHCAGLFGSGGYNVFPTGDSCNVNAGVDIRNVYANLGVLKANGGPTHTEAIAPLANGTLVAPINNFQANIAVTGTWTNHVSDVVWFKIDGELVQATFAGLGSGYTAYTVVRGVGGTTAASHNAAAAVSLVSPAQNLIPSGPTCTASGTDQRGKPRPSASSTSCDSGAYEVQ